MQSSRDTPETERENKFLLLDSNHYPLAHAVLESPPDSSAWRVRVTDDESKMEDLITQDVLQVVSMSGDNLALLGRVLHIHGRNILLEPLGPLGTEARENLRMPVRFDSLIYPVDNLFSGSLPIVSNDLSCGGIAFYCKHHFERGDRIEVVVPITSPQPLILKCEILRSAASLSKLTLYAAKFVDMIDDQEARVREAVFSVQIQKRPRPRKKQTNK